MEWTRETMLKYVEDGMLETGLNVHALEIAAGLKVGTVRDFIREKTHIMRADKFSKVQAAFEGAREGRRALEHKFTLVNPAAPSQLSASESGVEEIPVYDVRASAGAGALIAQENIRYHIAFQRSWLRRVTNATIDQLAVVSVDGDSMEPTLSSEDTVLVDLTQKHPNRDGIYVVRYDDSLLVKRIQIDPVRRKATILSDNPAYPPIDNLSPEEIQVIGRVLWLGRRV